MKTIKSIMGITSTQGAAGWLRWLSICLWLRSGSQGPGTEPQVDSQLSREPASPSASASPPAHALCISVSQMNNILKILKNKTKHNH